MTKPAIKKQKPLSWGVRAFQLLEDRIRALVEIPEDATTKREQASAALPNSVRQQLDAVLAATPSYRDGTLIQLAYRLVDEESFDMTFRQKGARTVAMKLGALFADLHVKSVKDAYQIIAKNTTHLVRGNVPQFDAFLGWANTAPTAELEAAFCYVAASAALTARPVEAMPELDRSKLTFAGVVALLNELLDTPSGGAHEQFALAAFLDALIDEYGASGQGGLYIETKNINASDASAGTAADVQAKRGNRTEEALEVTANEWTTKLAAAASVMRSYDLTRIHVVAQVNGGSIRNVEPLLAEGRRQLDISVLDIRALIHALAAFMRKPARASALGRLYELLDRKQPDVGRTNTYVALLRRHGLTL